MKIKRATKEYEDWLGTQLKIVQADMKQKHKNMAASPFIFLRATFYRWAQLWPKICHDLTDAPVVLAVGDLHIENFGTWRDTEGRLIWGVNDFDEAYPLPYTNDLVRLAASAKLAIEEEHLSISFKDACQAILDGYAKGLSKDGKPFVLGEEHMTLRKMAYGVLRDPVHFWERMDDQVGKADRPSVPDEAVSALEKLLPARAGKYDLVTRRAGEGSLGRQRFVALTVWHGGRIARETKALAPSAWRWANPDSGRGGKIYYADILRQAVRCADPFVAVHGSWVVRRLAPDCSRIDLATLPAERDERLLLTAMGFEIANIHLGSEGAAKAIQQDLKKRQSKWLYLSAKEMTAATLKDWKAWRSKSN
jgi:uncharacterized protein (DUF2252 family)